MHGAEKLLLNVSKTRTRAIINAVLRPVFVCACFFLAACHGGGGGGGGNPPAPPPSTFTIGGSVAGLAGSGLELRNNSGNPLVVTANGPFMFSGTVASGSTYNVTVAVQPTSSSQTCVVAGGAGTANANVANVSVTCTTNSFPVNVTVDGLFSGLIFGDLVLDNNGADPLTLTANGPAAFAANVASGAAYNVAVREQPNGTPQQTCTITGGTGTVGNGPATGIAVKCRAVAGRFLYVPVGPPANAVAAFTIDVDSGALTPIAGSPFAAAGKTPGLVVGELTGKFLYVFGDDNLTGPGDSTVTGFAVDPQTGALTPIPNMPITFPASASFSAAHPSGKFLYVTITDGAVNAHNQLYGFEIDAATGELKTLPGFPQGPFAGGEVLNSVVLSPDGSNLYLASSTPLVVPFTPPTGKIAQFKVDVQTGELTATGSQVTDPGNSFNQLFMHPAGTHMYTRNATSVAWTSRFTLDAATGAIANRFDVMNTTFGTGVLFDTFKKRVYFPELGGTFATPGPGSVGVAVDSAVNGVLSVRFETGGTNSTAGVLDPTRRFLAVTNLGSHDISILKVGLAPDQLVPIAGSPFAPAVGTAPGVWTFDPSARFAYVTDAAGSISSYVIDVDTGKPTFVNSEPTGGSPAAPTVKILGSQ
jgi:6-phosphogluconolactonase (cycloisomerase 2 family)